MALQIFSKHFKFFFLSAFALTCLAEQAHAVRIARFSAIGQNYIQTNSIKSDIESSCSITLTNPSNTPQLVTIKIRLYATSGGGATAGNCGPSGQHDYFGSGANGLVRENTHNLTLAANGTGTAGADCSSNSNTCTLPNATLGDNMDFPLICAQAAATQNVRCEGEITVENSTPGVPGHITASGTLTTVVESLGGVTLSTASFLDDINIGTSKTNTAAPTFTPIMIGEGKPF